MTPAQSFNLADMFVPSWREIKISQRRPVPGQFAAKTGPLEVKSVEAARWDRAENAGELMSLQSRKR
jgi:hypothetical protein